MQRRLALAVLALHGFSCGSDTKAPRSSPPASPPPAAPTNAERATDTTPPAVAPESTGAPAESEPEITAREKECVARLTQLGLEHGKDACKPKPPAAPLADVVQELPKKCAADSPRDRPCSSYGGVYKVRLEPDPAERATCFGKNAVETTVRLKADTAYGGRRDLSWELGSLLRAVKVRDQAPSLGSAVRDGVCCIDIDVSGEAKGRYKRIVLQLASGATVVNAEASIGCDDSGDRIPLKVQVTRVAPR